MMYSSTALYCWQVPLTTAEVQLQNKACSEVEVQNDPGSTTNLVMGVSGAEFMVLIPGQSRTVPVTNANLIWLKAATGTPTANILARN